MFVNCPFCGGGLLGTVSQTWSRVPLHEDGFDPSEGKLNLGEVISVYCPRCKWESDARYYVTGALTGAGEIPAHAHIGAEIETTGGYREYTAYYVAPRSGDDVPTWSLADWNGESDIGCFPTLVEAVRKAFDLLREGLGEDATPTYGSGCPSNIILRLALGE